MIEGPGGKAGASRDSVTVIWVTAPRGSAWGCEQGPRANPTAFCSAGEREREQLGLQGFAPRNWKNEIVQSGDGEDKERTHVPGKPRFLL